MNLNLGQPRGWVDVFDEQHVVALLVVNEIVELLFRDQKPEPTWSHALLFANGNVAKARVSRATDGSVAKFFEREISPEIPIRNV